MTMEDVRMRTVISKLAEVDPVFREVVSKLYPAVDPRELWDISKGMPDQSAAHVSGNGNSNKKKALAGGLLFGTAAEGMAVRSAFNHARSPQPKFIGPKPAGLKGALHAVNDAKRVHGGKAELGIQAVNMAVGLGAAKELVKPKKTGVSKSEFMEMIEPIIKARRDGVISTDKALEMVDEVEKNVAGKVWSAMDTRGAVDAVSHGVRQAKSKTGNLIFTNDNKGLRGFNHLNETLKMQHQFVQSPHAAEFREGANAGLHAGRMAVGTAAAGGVATVGYKKGKKKETEKLALGKAADDEVEYAFTGEISKMDPDKRQVFGWCSLSTVDGQPVVDLQNDYISIEEIEKSAYSYVRSSRKGGDMHARVGNDPVHTSDMIESVIVTPDKLRKMGVPEDAISKVHTGWWVGFQVNDDEQWRKVKSGERAGFSIHGKGARVEKMLED